MEDAVKFTNCAAQGDVMLRRIDSLPLLDNIKESPAVDSRHIVAHSETGHHHIIDEDEGNVAVYDTDDEFMSYLVVNEKSAYLWHNRSFDTHGTLEISPGIYEIRRQREYTPEGFRRVID